MKASVVRQQKRPALRTVRLEPSDWADTYDLRPSGGVAVGLRMISDAEESDARREATEKAGDPANVATVLAEYNDLLMAGVVSSALCDPNDCSRDPSELSTPQLHLRRALTSRAIRRLFNEWEVMAADASPSSPHADDDEVEELIDRLLDESLVLTNKARRLASALLEEVREGNE